MNNKEVYNPPNSELVTTKSNSRVFIFINYVVLVLGLLLALFFLLTFLTTKGTLFYQLQNIALPMILVFSSTGTIKSLNLGWRRVWGTIGLISSAIIILFSGGVAFYGLFLGYSGQEASDKWMVAILLFLFGLSLTNFYLTYKQKNA